MPGLELAEVTPPVMPGRKLAPSVDAAVRNHLSQISGFGSALDFIIRQDQAPTRDERTAS